MSLNGYQKACVSFFVLLLLFWVVLFFGGIKNTLSNDLFAFGYGLIPLFGGIMALVGYRAWGGLSTILGKAILLLGFGLFLWGCGETVYAYYNIFLRVEVPYPSIADLFFAPSVFFYALGTIYLSRTTGIDMALKKAWSKVFAVIIPIVAAAVAYFVQITVVHHGQLFSDMSSMTTIALDIAYPLGDAISLAVAGMVAGLSFRYLGGMYKREVMFILGGLAVMFVADSVFAHATMTGTKYNGDLGDLYFLIGMTLLTCGLLGFNKIKEAKPMPAD